MQLAIAPLDDVSDFLRTSALEIVLIVLSAVLLTRFATWFGDRVTGRIDAQAQESDELVRSEAAKHRHALAQVITYVAIVLVVVVASVLVVSRLGVPLSGLVAPATVVGVALGFGAQRIVQDVLAGFFLITERQYGYGDVVRLTALGAPTSVTGTVEDVTLRTTQLRTLDGEVVTTPNGQIIQVTNLSKDWARAVVDVPVPTGVDIARVTEVLQAVGLSAYDDEALRPLLLDPPTVMGVETLEADLLNIRLVVRTLPGKQFEVGREVRSRIALAMRAEGLAVRPSVETGAPTGAA